MTDDELLTPRPAPASDELRIELFARTARRLRFARRLRLASRVAICAVCFLTGLGLSLLRPTPEPQVITTVVRETAIVPPPPELPPKKLSPSELELEAEKTTVKAESARLFREAGDLYLRDHADYQSALRCYRNFLDEADPADRESSPDDTWLLTSLKRAREQETNP